MTPENQNVNSDFPQGPVPPASERLRMTHTTPPEFHEARTRRQKARAAGLDPNHWYAVEQSRRLGRGEVMETTFWGRSIAVFRGSDGVVRALENKCAHRQIKLTEGVVQNCRL